MSHAIAHVPATLLPEDQQLITIDLVGRRWLGRVASCSDGGRVSILVYDPAPNVRALIEIGGAIGVEYVRVGLCRTSFWPERVEQSGAPRAPMLVLHGRLGAVETLQRRDNFRVSLSLPMKLLLVKGVAEHDDEGEQVWWNGRTVNVGAEGLCVELRRELYKGDVIAVRVHVEARTLEADARIVGPRPVAERDGRRQYGLHIIQMPRADQQELAALVRREEQRGLAYRGNRWT